MYMYMKVCIVLTLTPIFPFSTAPTCSPAHHEKMHVMYMLLHVHVRTRASIGVEVGAVRLR